MWQRFEREIAKAWEDVRSIPSKRLATEFGVVEYATAGEGQPVLMSHGVMGGHPAGLGMVATYYGRSFAISPSRFGYFGSSLPIDATPAMQSDTYARLLDELAVQRAVVIGFSAGGPSAIEFALRHPERVDLLVLASSALPRAFGPMPSMARKLGPVFMRAALSSDWPFWLFKSLTPGTFLHLLGVPKGFVGNNAERATLEEVAASIFPIPPKRDGAVFDAFTGNPHVDKCPIEDITVPTLIVHAADDSLAPYQSARNAAARMPSARFMTINRGGHEFLGTEHVVREAIKTYLNELREGQPREHVGMNTLAQLSQREGGGGPGLARWERRPTSPEFVRKTREKAAPATPVAVPLQSSHWVRGRPREFCSVRCRRDWNYLREKTELERRCAEGRKRRYPG